MVLKVICIPQDIILYCVSSATYYHLSHSSEKNLDSCAALLITEPVVLNIFITNLTLDMIKSQ